MTRANRQTRLRPLHRRRSLRPLVAGLLAVVAALGVASFPALPAAAAERREPPDVIGKTLPEAQALIRQQWYPEFDPTIRVTADVSGPSTARDVADAAIGLMELDLADLLASGWQKHTALQAARRRTREAPGTQESVVLAEHRISYEAHPYVDVLLAADATGLAASVIERRLVGLSSGRALVSAALELAGVPVARRSTEIRLPLDLSLGDGLRLG